MRRKGWSDLPPDLLREIAGRLHVAADFVSFHAVCKPWRSSRDLLSEKQLLPWLLAPTETNMHCAPLKLRCVFSKSGYRVMPPPHPRRRNCVCSADGATVRYLTLEQLRPTLHDPITGAVTHLPCFAHYRHHNWEENSRGIVYEDGTVFLYDISYVVNGGMAIFRAALLGAGGADWVFLDRTFQASRRQGEFCATYHSGRILVTGKSGICHVITPDGNPSPDMLVPKPKMPDEHNRCWERYNYFLESRGELLWASVHVKWYCSTRFVPQVDTFFVWVHALEEAAVHGEKARWVRKEGHFLADRTLFLGSPNSFSIDASLLGGQGGCAYFVCHNREISMGHFGLFRFNFADGKGELIERLSQEWDNDKCTWFAPQPTIAPLQEITKRLEAHKLKKQQKEAPPIARPSRIFHIERHYEHRFQVLVRNLPPKVKNSQLHFLFSKHGKVSSTEIIYNHENTNTSEGTAIVRIATMHACQEHALSALHKLDFDGCSLDVTVVNERQRRRRHKEA